MDQFRVMVVDDDPDVRFVVQSLLSLNYETISANNGLDALEKLDRTQPDLILMDVNMPIMNGLACCNAVKRNPDFENLPVIFLSASSDKRTQANALALGGKGYLEKPFDGAKLFGLMEEVIKDSGLSPSGKRFSTVEIAKIDTTPLESLDAFGVEGYDPKPIVSALQGEMDADGTKKRVRRVFGRKEKPASAPEVAPENRDIVELPEPPKPQYGRISAKQPEPASPDARQSDNDPIPLASTPRELPHDVPDLVPPTPKDLLLQRRKAAIPRKDDTSKSGRPRVLVLIDHGNQLELCHQAFKGIAEFLPLEDPVQAIELIARFQPDMVMLGIVGKTYSGVQAAQMLRSNPRLSHTEIVFVQAPWTEAKDLAAAQRITQNSIVRFPLSAESLRVPIQMIIRKPNFHVRQKQLSYGVYVNEVIRQADDVRKVSNKEKEKESFSDEHEHLLQFMAKELKGYQEPQGVDELYGPGRHVHRIEKSNDVWDRRSMKCSDVDLDDNGAPII